MTSDRRRPLRILPCSSGNPAATFLAAVLLHGEVADVDAVLVQGVGDATSAQEVLRTLAEVGIDLGGWRPRS
jgi:hypothetical protein